MGNTPGLYFYQELRLRCFQNFNQNLTVTEMVNAYDRLWKKKDTSECRLSARWLHELICEAFIIIQTLGDK